MKIASQLTALQVRCLQLVEQNYSIRAIAQITGQAEGVVEQCLDEAAQLLDASNRREAASLAAPRPLNFETLETELTRLAGIVRYLQKTEDARLRALPGASLGQWARRLLKESDLRGGILETGMFADPAWHILLDLFAAEEEGRKISISSACIASRVPPTTALRWVKVMEEQGALVREYDPRDGRRVYVRLSPETRLQMEAYLQRVAEWRNEA
ncbi:MAG: hypothetical protein QM605_13395 [Sphingobium sp.]